jgi:hypothetical protein
VRDPGALTVNADNQRYGTATKREIRSNLFICRKPFPNSTIAKLASLVTLDCVTTCRQHPL